MVLMTYFHRFFRTIDGVLIMYNYKVLAVFCLLVYKFETFCGVSGHHLAALVQKELQNSKEKKGFYGHPIMHL